MTEMIEQVVRAPNRGVHRGIFGSDATTFPYDAYGSFRERVMTGAFHDYLDHWTSGPRIPPILRSYPWEA